MNTLERPPDHLEIAWADILLLVSPWGWQSPYPANYLLGTGVAGFEVSTEDHPPGGHDDLANVVCGLAVSLAVAPRLEWATW